MSGPNEPTVIQVTAVEGTESVKGLTTALNQLKKTLVELANTPAGQLQKEMAGLVTSLTSISTTLEAMFTKGMEGAKRAARKGAKEAVTEMQNVLNADAPTVKIKTTMAAVGLPGGSRLTGSISGNSPQEIAAARKEALASAGATDPLDTARKMKDAEFTLKSLDKQLAMVNLINQARKEGIALEELRQKFGNRAVWYSSDSRKDGLSKKVELEQELRALNDLKAAQDKFGLNDAYTNITAAETMRAQIAKDARLAEAAERAKESKQWDDYYAHQAKMQRGHHDDQAKDQVNYQNLMSKIRSGQALDQIKDAEILAKWLEKQRQGTEADELKDVVNQQKLLEKIRKGAELDRIKDAEAMGKWLEKQRLAQAADEVRDELRHQAEMKALRAAAIRDRDLNAQFENMTPQGQLARATRISKIAVDGAGADYARSKYGSSAVDAAEPAALATLAAEVQKLEIAKKALSDAKSKGKKPTDDLTKANRDLDAGMRELHSGVRGLSSGFGAMWLTWGSILPLMAGAAVSNAAVQAVKMGAEVGQSLMTIQALAGATSAEIAKLNTALGETARSGPFGPAEVATALKTLALAGLDATEQMQALKPVLDFAVAGTMGIEKSAETLVAVSTAFGYQTRDMSVVSDIIAKAAAISMASTEGMASSFRVASVVAEQYKVSLTDVATSLALLAQIGIKDQAAGTAVRNMYTELMGQSAKARAVLQKVLKVDIYDGNNLKSLPTLYNDLAESLVKLTPKAQNAALALLGNERGTKSISANLAAVAGDFQKSGLAADAYINKLKEVQQKLDDAPGFSAIAAVGMAGSTLNQMKQTASNLQQTLVDAFQAAEPTILRVTVAMRDMFNSEGFRGAVASILTSVADFTGLLVKHIDTVLDVVKVYLVYKTATVSFAVGSGVAAAATALLTGSFFANVGAAATLNLALGATRVHAYGAAVAMTTLNAVMRANPFVLIATVVATAASAYWLFSESQKAAAAEAKKTAADLAVSKRITVENLDKELARLDILLKSKGDDEVATKLQAEAVRDAALEAVDANGAITISSLEAAKARVLQSSADYDWLDGLGLVSKSTKEIMAQSRAARIADIDETIRLSRRGTQAEKDNLAAKFELVRTNSKLARDMAEGRKRPGLPFGTGEFDPDTLTRKAGGSGDGVSEKSNEMAMILKKYETQRSLIQAEESDTQKMLSSLHSNKLLSDSGFYAAQLSISDAGEARLLQENVDARADYVNAFKRDMATLESERGVALAKAGKGKGEGVNTAFDTRIDNKLRELDANLVKFDAEADKARSAATAKQILAQYTLEGSTRALTDAYTEYRKAQEDGDEKQAREISNADALRNVSDRVAVGMRAEFAEREKLMDQIDKYTRQIRAIDSNVESDKARLKTLGLTPEKLAAANAKVDAGAALQRAALTSQVSEVTSSLDTRPGAKRDQALGQFDKLKQDQGDWSKGATKALRDYETAASNVAGSTEKLFTKAFQGMEDGLVDFVTKGKMDFASLRDSIIADMIRIQIQKMILGIFGMFTNPFATAAAATLGPVPSFTPTDFSLGSGKIGGSYASGTDYVPNDMIAQIHKGERIIPAEQNARMQRNLNNGSGSSEPQQVIHVTQNFTVGDVASMSDVRKAVMGSEQRIQAGFQRSRTYRGVAA